jgi:hypothetical protein
MGDASVLVSICENGRQEKRIRNANPARTLAADLSRHSHASPEGGQEKYEQFFQQFNDLMHS